MKFRAILPDFIEKKLNEIASDTGFIDYSLETDSNSKTSNGYIGVMGTVKIVGWQQLGDTKTQKELSLIYKTEPINLAQRNAFSVVMAFNREEYFYNTVLPYLTKFQAEKGLLKINGFFQYPNCYYACGSNDTQQNIVIMDDLRDEGFEHRSESHPITFNDAQLFVKAIGRLHALSFAIRDQRPNIFKEFESILKHCSILHMINNGVTLKEINDSAYRKAINLFSANNTNPDILEYLKSAIDTWAEDVRDCLEPNDENRFSVIGHGDCWLPNLMFKPVNFFFLFKTI